MNRLAATTLVLAACLSTLTAADAHHSFTQFDRSTELVKTGTVVRWAFNNPHSWLYLNIADEDGNETLWSFEAAAPAQLIVRGITGMTFEPGSTLTFMFCPMVNGRPGGHLGWARLSDGRFLSAADGGCNGSQENIARWKGWLAQGFTSNKEAEAAE
jgi:Family of unknown function (DUF6152)